MNRPYIICHMVTSIDGKVTGDFLYRPECEKATEIYYDINRDLKCNGFICGRVTMEGSFTGGWYPDLTSFVSICKEAKRKHNDRRIQNILSVYEYDIKVKLFLGKVL